MNKRPILDLFGPDPNWIIWSWTLIVPFFGPDPNRIVLTWVLIVHLVGPDPIFYRSVLTMIRHIRTSNTTWSTIILQVTNEYLDSHKYYYQSIVRRSIQQGFARETPFNRRTHDMAYNWQFHVYRNITAEPMIHNEVQFGNHQGNWANSLLTCVLSDIGHNRSPKNSGPNPRILLYK